MGIPRTGEGYNRSDGVFVPQPSIIMLPRQAYAAGQTIGEVMELGENRRLALTLEVFAVSGSNPTLDVDVQTSPDGKTSWRSIPLLDLAATPARSFRRKSGVGFAMSAVTETGTTPPDITLTGSPNQPINLRVECTTLGARGVAVIRYSIDGGSTWTENVLTAATINVLDNAGVATGLVLNYENATAAVDNVWTAFCIGYERKVFDGCDRFARCVARVGGTGGPTVTASCIGEVG